MRVLGGVRRRGPALRATRRGTLLQNSVSGAWRQSASGAGTGGAWQAYPRPTAVEGPSSALGGGPQAERDTPTTRRDQEVVASRTGGPKLFVRISGLATPPCSLFVDLVVELYSAGAARVPSPSCSPIGTENFTGPGRWGRGPRFGSGSALNRQDVAATESWQWSDN